MKRAMVVVLFGSLAAATGGASEPDALARLREALGGEHAINAVRTVRVRATIDRTPHKDHVEIKAELPDRFFRTLRYFRVPELQRRSASDSAIWVPDVRSTGSVLDTSGPGEAGVTMSGFVGMTPIPKRNPYETELDPDSKVIAAFHARFAEFILPLTGRSSSVYPVAATSEGNSIVFHGNGPRWWQIDLDPNTNLPMRMSWTSAMPTGASVPPGTGAGVHPTYWQVDFSEFKNVGGLRWPHRLIKSRNGEVTEDTTIEKYDLNVALKFPR